MKLSLGQRKGIIAWAMLLGLVMASFLMPLQAQARISALSRVIDITDDNFTPDTLTVKVGEKITWINDGEMDHTVTSAEGVFNTRHIPPDGHATITFSEPGTYTYFCCTPTPLSMGTKGQIIVEPNA